MEQPGKLLISITQNHYNHYCTYLLSYRVGPSICTFLMPADHIVNKKNLAAWLFAERLSSSKKQHGVYHFISKDSSSRKAFYVWRYDPTVGRNRTKNPFLRTASTATLKVFPLIDEEELIVDQVMGCLYDFYTNM